MKERNTQMDIPKLTASLDKLAVALERKNQLEEKRLMLEHKKFLFEQHKYKKDNTDVSEKDMEKFLPEDFRNI